MEKDIDELDGISGLSGLDDSEDWVAEDEMGEDEQEEAKSESSAGINFNKANSESSEEEDIIQDAMKKNRAKLEDLDEEYGPSKKRRKVDVKTVDG